MGEKKQALVTWSSPWQQVDGFNGLDIEFVQVPLIKIVITPQSGLKDVFQDRPGRILIFSKSALKGLMASIGGNSDVIKSWKFAVVGRKSAGEAQKIGLSVDYVGSGTSVELVEVLLPECQLSPWVVLCGNIGGDEVISLLESAKREYQCFEVYQNREPESAQRQIDQHIESIDAILLSSPSAAQRLLKNRKLKRIKILSIGPSTTKSINELGYQVDWQASKPSYESFAQGLKSLFLT